MTRINLSIPVENLTDEHLKAEHREIKRICHNYLVRKVKNKFDDIPKHFTLGTGHVLFFIDKPFMTLRRYQKIHAECKRRNFIVQNYSQNWVDSYGDISNKFWNNQYEVRPEDTKIVLERISGIINKKHNYFWHYMGVGITNIEAVRILNRNV